MNRLFYLILIISFYFSNSLLAQDKFEKESRIKVNEVPVKAANFIRSLELNSKIKWYQEEGLNRKSIEAKFKYQQQKYSVEFDTLGHIEDVEVEINWSEIEPTISQLVLKQLEKDCLGNKIIKVQQQFTDQENDLNSLLKNKFVAATIVSKFEIIVRCNTAEGVYLFEYLFNDKGQIESKFEIVFKNSSHLEY
jgi:capsule polysaccharide export protein KpsE/RkpR